MSQQQEYVSVDTDTSTIVTPHTLSTWERQEDIQLKIGSKSQSSKCVMISFTVFILMLLVITVSTQIREPVKQQEIVCFIYPRAPSEQSIIRNQIQSLAYQQKRGYRNWRLHYYLSEGYPNQIDGTINYVPGTQSFIRKHASVNGFFSFNKVKFHRLSETNFQTENLGRNIYDAIKNECPKNSIAFILKENQHIASNQTLFIIQQMLGRCEYSKDFVGNKKCNMSLITPVLLENKVGQMSLKRVAIQNITTFRRDQYFVNTLETNISDSLLKTKNLTLAKQVMQHMRIFRTQWYDRIPYLYLMNDSSTFFESFLVFQLPMIQTNERRCKGRMVQQCVPQFPHLSITPTYQPLIKVYTEQYLSEKPSNLPEIITVGNKQMFECLSDTMSYAYIVYSVTGKAKTCIMEFWKKTNFNVLYSQIKSTDPDLIPKKIHQIWVGEEIPQYKKKFMSQFKKVMPDFEYYLWTNDNVTRQNFPRTYDILMDLFQLDKTFERSRMAMICDIMRIQILLQNGGFYFDTNYEPFRNFNEMKNIRKYSFVASIMGAASLGLDIMNSVMFAEKGFEKLEQLLSPEKIAKINRTGNTFDQTGPNFVASAFSLEDLYSKKVKLLPAYNIYPHGRGNFDQRWHVSKCTLALNQTVPEQFNASNYEMIEVDQEHRQVFPCKAAYPLRFGVDHYSLGGSWHKPRAKQ